MSLADRALQAYKAKQEEKNAANAALTARWRSQAIQQIWRKADDFGVALNDDGLVQVAPLAWEIQAVVDDDTNLVFTYRGGSVNELVVRVRVCDQLYWDLPPEQTKKDGGGGTYGCFGLTGIHERGINDLADLGEQLQRVRKARHLWEQKHGARKEQQ